MSTRRFTRTRTKTVTTTETETDCVEIEEVPEAGAVVIVAGSAAPKTPRVTLWFRRGAYGLKSATTWVFNTFGSTLVAHVWRFITHLWR
jgi:hypothetical protein